MVVAGGPDEEIWAKIGKESRKNYWIIVIAFLLLFFGAHSQAARQARPLRRT